MSPKIRAVFVKELRDSLRDRRTLFASVVVPLLLYPIMLLGLAEVSQIARAKLEREVYTVAIPLGATAFFENLSKMTDDAAFADIPGLEPTDNARAEAMLKKLPAANPPAMPGRGPVKAVQPALKFQEMEREAALKALLAGDIKAIVLIPEDFESTVRTQEQSEVEIKYDQAEQRSRDAANRVEALFDRLKKQVLSERLKAQNLNTAFLKPFVVTTENVAHAAKVGGSLIGSFLPLLFIMMIITGAIYPAIDMTAGEKERATLETLISMPVRPIEIIAGKFLAIAAMSLGNAALNVGSFALTFSMLPAPQAANLAFPWNALPLTMLLLVPLALFFSGLLLAVASFAANQKEAQIYCLPIYLVPVLGMMVVMMPGIELDGPLLLTPVVNTALLIKELFLGHGTARQIMFVFVSTCLYAAGAVALAARVFAREEVLFSAQASLRLFLNRRFFKPAAEPKPGDSLVVVALLFPIFYYSQLWLGRDITDPNMAIPVSKLIMMVCLPQYVLFLALPMLVSWYLKLDFKRTFLWKLPPLKALAGSVCLGISSFIIVAQLITWQSYFWEQTPGSAEMISKSIAPLRETVPGMALIIFLVGVTPAICEEHLFRGFLLQGLRRSGKWGPIALVGVVFGAYHVTLFQQPVLILMGMVMAYAAYQTRSIWPGVIYHLLHNSISVMAANFEKPEPGQAEGVPLQYLLPAVAVFSLGLYLISRVDPDVKEKNGGAGHRDAPADVSAHVVTPV